MTAMLVLFGVWILITVVVVNAATLDAKPEKRDLGKGNRESDPF
jgi:hypothetical protein